MNARPNTEHPADRKTLADIVHWRAANKGDAIAYTFLADGAGDARSLTWSQLGDRARALGSTLVQSGARGKAVLLALPSGLAFVESLFGCWHAGAIAVPVSLPRHQRVKHRLDLVVADAGAHFAIGTAETRQRLVGAATEQTAIGELTWIDEESAGNSPPDSETVSVARDDVALLQYTSGSTGAPRGVIVTHANLMHNSALICQACGHHPAEPIAGWLPLFHDMGLIGLVMQAAFSGARLIFMSPERFLMRPRLWLQMISEYRACSSPAPNFAYDLCVDRIDDAQKAGLDLSCWRNALNGSEPVRAATLERFAAAFAQCRFQRKAFFPCYGLAESTLFVTGPGKKRDLVRRGVDGTLLLDHDAGGHVACGHAFDDTQLAIVDPQSSRPVAPGAIGEIWVAGGSVARGYWNNPQATAATFDGKLDSAVGGVSARAWLRTGDLGFVADGDLFITGRLRELIIIAGRNLFPIDVERTVEAADPAIATSGSAAFSTDVAGVEKLIVVAEVRRELARPARGQTAPLLDHEATRRRIRAAVAAEHEAAVHEVVLLAPGALPRTTSGKVSRRTARDCWLNNTLEQLAGSIHDHVAV